MTDAIDAAEESPAPKWWHVSWKRVAIALVSVFAVLWFALGAVLLVLYQFGPSISADEMSRIEPRVNLVPADLPYKNLAPLQGARIECLGISLQTPSTEIDQRGSSGTFCTARAKSGWSILISDPFRSFDIAQMMRSEPRMAKMYGLETLSSNYALTSAAMQTTPDRIKWWQSRSRNARFAALLAVKLTNISDTGTLYAIALGEMRGFQEGDPSSAPFRVKLNLFDAADHHYDIVITTRWENGPILTQAEINAMVASIKPIPAH